MNRAERRKRASDKRRRVRHAIKAFRQRPRKRAPDTEVSSPDSEAQEGQEVIQEEAAQ